MPRRYRPCLFGLCFDIINKLTPDDLRSAIVEKKNVAPAIGRRFGELPSKTRRQRDVPAAGDVGRPQHLDGAQAVPAAGSVFYGVGLALAGPLFLGMRVHVTQHGVRLHASIPPEAVRRAVRQGMLSRLLCAAGAARARVDTRLAWAVFVPLPLPFILPGAFKRMTHRLGE